MNPDNGVQPPYIAIFFIRALSKSHEGYVNWCFLDVRYKYNLLS